MEYFIVQMQFIFMLAWYLTVALMVSGSESLQCSCYTFHANTSDFSDSRNMCKSNGGDLVSMETLNEWEFIKAQLQNKTTSSGQDQWWISLERKNGVWQWSNGFNLTYDKWQPNLDLHKHAVMEKKGGVFWNLYWYNTMGSICEYTGAVCNGNQVRWCYKVTTTSQPTTILRDTTMGPTTILRDTTMPIKKSIVPSVITVEPTVSVTNTVQTSTLAMTTNSSAEDKNDEASRTDKPFPVLIIVIVLVVLLVCIGIFIIVYICRKKRKNRGNNKRPHKEETAMEDQERQQFLMKSSYINGEKSQDESSCIYATVDKSKKTSHANEPEYAVVNQSDKASQDQPQELNYAELTDFPTDEESQEIKRPPPYQPTEYASVTMQQP